MAIDNTARRLSTRQWFALGLIFIVVVSMVLLVWLFFFTSPALSDNDTRDIKGVALTAFNASSQLVVIPRAPTDLKKKLSPTAIATARSRAHQVFSSIYAPGYTYGQEVASQVDSTLTHEADGYERALDAGVRDIDWRNVRSIDSNTASITLAATAWSRVIYVDMNGKQTTFDTTEGRVEIYTLSKINNRWLITNVTLDTAATKDLPVNRVHKP
ncbi:MAG TPA: hypothetical protein VKX46_00725 [Ktedonobacteraceae bacterium]|nr:hypothetical protein [Ktedonobacteraceae bacterium]